MRGRHSIAVVIGLVGLILIVGCGGDDANETSAPANGPTATEASTATDGDSGASAADGDETGVPVISKEEFIAQGNALCAKRSAELAVDGQRVFKEVRNKPNPVSARALVDKVIVPTFESELSDLRALDPPPADSDEVYAIFEAIEEMIDKVKDDPSTQNYYPYKKAERLAAAYGLTACGHP
jgi:hypothetical protein